MEHQFFKKIDFEAMRQKTGLKPPIRPKPKDSVKNVTKAEIDEFQKELVPLKRESSLCLPEGESLPGVKKGHTLFKQFPYLPEDGKPANGVRKPSRVKNLLGVDNAIREEDEGEESDDSQL